MLDAHTKSGVGRIYLYQYICLVLCHQFKVICSGNRKKSYVGTLDIQIFWIANEVHAYENCAVENLIFMIQMNLAKDYMNLMIQRILTIL